MYLYIYVYIYIYISKYSEIHNRLHLLLEFERIAQRNGHADDDDGALGRVGHRGGHGAGRLDGHGRELVVPVKTRCEYSEDMV